MRLGELKDKNILILGLGKEGIDTFRFLMKAFPNKTFGLADKLTLKKLNPKTKKLIVHISYGRGNRVQKVKLHLGKGYLQALKNYDVIVKSPGVPIHLPEIEKVFKKGKITSQTEIFFENCPGKIVGVTGTKGKSTTASLIYKILKAGNLKVHLVGNIGRPVLNLLFSATPNDIYVYELSSHQLFNLKKSPHVTVFLNIYPEHLDYYRNFKEYLLAKQNIARYQRKEDYFVFNNRDKNVRETAKITKAKRSPIPNYSNILKNIGIRKLPLVGEHNLLNIASAIKVGEIFEIPKEKIKRAIENFKPLPHRLELVGTFKGITFYNDALSTIPETTIAAIDALGKSVQTIVLGGFDRGLDFKNLAKRILKSKIKNIILFPTTGEKIWKALRLASLVQGKKLPKHFFVDRAKRTSFSSSPSPRYGGAQYMKDAVKLAYQYTKKGEICLLSCASPSFSIFRDYKEKGDLFKRYVKIYGKS